MKRKQKGRGSFLLGAGAMLAAPVILESTRAYAATPTLQIGHVSLSTGPLAGFAEAGSYVLSGTEEALSGGVENSGKPWSVEIVSTDSQSNLTRTAEVAADLILGEELDIIVAASTTDTVNQVSADQAEIKEVPCITTDCPWQVAIWFIQAGTGPCRMISRTTVQRSRRQVARSSRPT